MPLIPPASACKKSDTDNTGRKQGGGKLAGKGPKGFGGLAGSLDVRDAVVVEGDRSGQDVKNMTIFEKNAPTPTSIRLS
jgi:hypothetical protein